MSEICHNLFIGSFEDALSSKFMTERPTAVLNVSRDLMRSPYAVEYLQLPVNDNPNENISVYFNKAISFIESALKRNMRVLVHCFAGISRSATVVIAYLMKKCNMTFNEAYKFVKARRNIINPNMGFVYQLSN